MSLLTKAFRIFVSSTFSDMKAERNALQEKVFPELQKLCEANGCRFQAVDLRWGVSEEAALDQQTMNICLTELKRCQAVSPRPNFIILLGDRYGWIPLPPQIEASEFEAILSWAESTDKSLLADWYQRDTNAVPQEYVLRPRREEVFEETDYASWRKTEERLRVILLGDINSLGWPANDKRRIKYECSATHQEIIEGALKLPDEREHVFAFLRNIRNVEDLPPGSDYSDDGLEKARALKEMIKETKGVTSHSYDVTWRGQDLDSHIEQFVADALASLRRIIDEELRQLKQIDERTRENIAHKEFGTERCRHFVGRQKILDDIAAYIRGNQPYPLVIYGPSGSGKSALLAKAVLDATGKEKPAAIAQHHHIQRFIGATPESTDIRTLLRNLYLEIFHAFEFDSLKEQELAKDPDFDELEAIMLRYDIPKDYRDLSERFQEFLGIIPKDRQLFLYLDALDQLSTTESAHNLNWLPTTLPANVKIIVSMLEREDEAGQCLRSARSKVPESALLRLEDMTLEEGKQVLYKWLLEAYPEKKRDLTDEQMKSVLTGFRGCSQPLYLKFAFEEARRWKSYDGLPHNADNVPGLAGDIPGIVGDMLARLQDKRQHGEVLVKTFLGLLSAAWHGLSESEILELLSADEAVMADLKARSIGSPDVKGIPSVVWLRLYYDLAPYLTERSTDNTVLFNFYHRQVGETIKRDYIRPAWHTHLACYFRKKADPDSDSTWSGNYVHGLSELTFQQTESSSMWDELESTLTDINFIVAKCKAGMSDKLAADYCRAEQAWPGQEEEKRKGEERQQRVHEYAEQMVAYSRMCSTRSGMWGVSRLMNQLTKTGALPPAPPHSLACTTDLKSAMEHHVCTPLEKIRTWMHFVSNHTAQLISGKEPAFQVAYNSTGAGPVAEALQERLEHSEGPTTPWLALINRPPFLLHPACLKIYTESARISAVAVTPDARTAVVGSGDTVSVWDLETGDSRILNRYQHEVKAIDMTPDGRYAVSASGIVGGTVCVWDLETGDSRVFKHSSENGGIAAISITPDGRYAVSGCAGGLVCLWDLHTGVNRIIRQLQLTIKPVAALTPDGRYVVSGSCDYRQPLCVTNVETGESRNVSEAIEVSSISLTSAGRCAVIDRWNSLWITDLENGESRKIKLPWGGAKVLRVTPDCRHAVSDYGPKLRVWDIETGESRILAGHTGPIEAISITPDGRRAVTGSWDHTLRLWDLELGESYVTEDAPVLSIVATPNGWYTFAAADAAMVRTTLRVWNSETEERRDFKGHSNEIIAVCVTPDGRCAVSAGRDVTMRVWDLQTAESRVFEVQQTIPFHVPTINAISITPDGRCAVTLGADCTVRIWDLVTGKSTIVPLKREEGVASLLMTPDGYYAVLPASFRPTSKARMLNLSSNQINDFGENSGRPLSVTPDGRSILFSAHDGLWLWNLATETKKLIAKASVKAACFTPDGQYAVSWDPENVDNPLHVLRVWNIRTGEDIAICYSQVGRIYSIAMRYPILVIGTWSGQTQFLRLIGKGDGTPLSLIGPRITTLVRLWLYDPGVNGGHWDEVITATCDACTHRFPAPVSVLDTIRSIMRCACLNPPDSPCLKLPDEAWDEPCLISECPRCHELLKFNPFVVDNRDAESGK